MPIPIRTGIPNTTMSARWSQRSTRSTVSVRTPPA